MFGATSGSFSGTSSGGPHPPLESDKCGGLPLPPLDHARSTSSHLALTGSAAPAAPSCSFLGRDSNQAFGHYPEQLAVAAAEWVYSQQRKSNNSWCSITMFSFLVPCEVVGAASSSCSGIPSGGRTLPPLESEITVMVLPLTPLDHPMSTPSHLAYIGGAAPAASSFRVLGRDSDQPSGHFPECLAVAASGQVYSMGVRAIMCGALLQCPLFCFC